MTLTLASGEPPPHAAAEAQQAFQEWQQGNQPGALARVQQYAERDEPWALAMLVWLYIQQGVGSYRAAVPYATKARTIGMPWVAATLVNNMMAQAASDVSLLDEAIQLAGPFPLFALGFDPMGTGWNLVSQGQAPYAVRIWSVTGYFPFDEAGWQSLANTATERLREIEQSLSNARASEVGVQQAADEGVQAITEQQARLETAARQANLLVSNVNAGAVNTLFKADAKRREDESKVAWRWGLAVLLGAASVAILPLVLHYFGAGPSFSSSGLLAAHAASTVALATVAGVLLARARGRDQASQRSNDLSTAMGTMITYSNQISDEGEKQRYLLTMGQLVLQAHLQLDTNAKEDQLSGLASLVSAIRAPGSN